MAFRILASQQFRHLSLAARTALKKTPLYDFHVSKGGKMVPFAGWSMPVLYGNQGIVESHIHTRKAASIFDVSHMLQMRISGKDALTYIETAVVADVKGLEPGKGTLTIMTTEKGGIIDDMIVTKTVEGYIYAVSNAGCADKDLMNLKDKLAIFKSYNSKADVDVCVIEDFSLIALQGPAMTSILQPGLKDSLDKLVFMKSVVTEVFGIPNCRVTRCGYTGEDGVEISVPSKNAVQLAEELLKNEAAKMAGLGARDTLRLEAGLCLYGNDIDETTTPIEAALAWLIPKKRRAAANFPGAKVILGQLKEPASVKRRRVGLKSNAGPPARPGANVVLAEDPAKVVGHVTSGTMAPSLPKTNVAMAYVKKPYLKDAKLAVDIRGRKYDVEIAKMPFVPAHYYTGKK